MPDDPPAPDRGAPDQTPGVESALPPSGARVLAFAAIVVAGVCGGLIGWAVTDLQCTGSCSTETGLGALLGALVAAGGVAVVAVLVLRAMGEWRTIQHRGGAAPGRRPPS